MKQPDTFTKSGWCIQGSKPSPRFNRLFSRLRFFLWCRKRRMTMSRRPRRRRKRRPVRSISWRPTSRRNRRRATRRRRTTIRRRKTAIRGTTTIRSRRSGRRCRRSSSFISYPKRAGVPSRNPHYGCESTTPAELLCVGFLTASDASVEQLIHPHVKDELQQLPHDAWCSFNLFKQHNAKCSSVGDKASLLIATIPV
jgi:hypothetical protein